MLYASSTVDTITSCSQFFQTYATQTRKIDKFLTWYKALVLLCSLGEKSAKWVAIFSIIIRLQKRNNEWLLQGNVNNARSQLQSNEQRKSLQWPKSFIKPKKTFEWLMKTLSETKENIRITKENHLNYQRKPFEWLKKPIQWSTKPFEWSLQKTLSMTDETHDEQPSKRRREPLEWPTELRCPWRLLFSSQTFQRLLPHFTVPNGFWCVKLS